MKKSEKHGELLNQLLEREGVSVAEFYTWLEDEVSSITTIYNMIKSDKITKARICLTCQLFDISPTYFGLPEDAFAPKRSTSKDDGQLIQYNYYEEPASDYRIFVDDIFNSFFKTLALAEKSLYVMDYTERRRGISGSKYGNYHERNAQFFTQVEEKLQKNPAFNYIRILQAPYHPVHFGTGFSFEQELEKMIGLLFEETFRHICHCFRNYENQFLLMLIPPVRIFSYYIFDEETVISEYLRFDRHGIPAPNLLFNNKKAKNDLRSINNRLIQHYTDEINYYVKESEKPVSFKIDKFAFIKGTIQHGRTLKNELTKLEQEIEHQTQAEFNFDENVEIVETLAALETKKHQMEVAKKKIAILNEVFSDLSK